MKDELINLQLKDGDLVVVKLAKDDKGNYSKNVMETMANEIAKLKPELPNAHFLIVPDCFTFEVIDKEMLSALGLYRIENESPD